MTTKNSSVRGEDVGREVRRAASAIEQRVGKAPGASRSAQDEREKQALVQYTQELGKIHPSCFLDGLPKTNEPSTEHDVFFRRSDQRVVKVTKLGLYGFIVVGLDGERIHATPVEYFQRMALYTRVFDDDVRFEGVILVGKKKYPCIVTSQPFVVARSMMLPYPMDEDIAEYMQRLRFTKNVRAEVAWKRESDGVECFDCKPANYIMTKKGAVPIDIIIRQTGVELPIPAPVWARKMMKWSRAQPLPPLKDVLEQFRASPEPYKSKGN